MAQDVLNTATFLIAIGGSAGSLNVLLQLLPVLQLNDRTAVVIVLHRKNDNDSMLSELLATRAIHPVTDAGDKEPILPCHIYLAPSDYHLLIEKEHIFSLDDSEKINYSRPSIDATFETAAYAYHEDLICILLSGANVDGTGGLAIVRREGGHIIVQNPGTAVVPFMPQNAIDSSIPDAVLDPADIAGYLMDYLH